MINSEREHRLVYERIVCNGRGAFFVTFWWTQIKGYWLMLAYYQSFNDIIEPVHEISNKVVCATNKVSDQPAHTRSLIRAFASRLSII